MKMSPQLLERSLVQVYGLLNRPLKRMLYWLFFVALFSSALEAVGVSLAFMFIKLISDPDDFWTHPVISEVIGRYNINIPDNFFIYAAILLASLYLLKNLFLTYASYAQNRFAELSAFHISKKLFKGYLIAPYERIFDRNTADLIISTNMSAYVISTRYILTFITIITEILIITGVLAVLFFSEPIITLSTVFCLGSILVLFHLIIRKYHLRWSKEKLALESIKYKCIIESLSCLKDVKVLNRENYFLNKYSDVRSKIVDVTTWQATANTYPRLISETTLIWMVVLVIIISLSEGRPNESMIATLGLFAFSGFRIIPSLNRLTIAFGNMKSGKPYLEQIQKDLLHFKTLPPQNNRSTVINGPISQVQFRNISYAYPSASTNALTNLNFTIIKGQSTGIVGSTGAGKTSLVDVVLGLLNPSQGSVFVDNVDIDTTSPGWKKLLGYVPQDVTLVDNTIRRNIALGIPDEEILDENMNKAVNMASLEDVITNLPEGLDTEIGERGVKLSGGQRQRIGIARALYHDPEILVLDEATSALDTETEHEIIKAVKQLAGTKTLFIIAHRLSTVRDCDQLLYLRDGSLIDVGTFDEIRDRNQHFSRMVHFAEVNGKSLDVVIDDKQSDLCE